ncbi:insulinase family protein [Novosphingobium panipatense]|uniref:insulinase family protein n=1 Tax=Novosphingobium panipatense TaxID=428991 RepID=UPI003619F191
MGGNLSLTTGPDSTSAMIDVLSDSAPAAIGLVADVLQRPDFPASELEKVKADLGRTLTVAKSTPARSRPKRLRRRFTRTTRTGALSLPRSSFRATRWIR